MRKLVPLVAALILVAVACGGDEEPVDSTTTSSPTATTVALPTTASLPSPPTTSQVAPTTAEVQPEPEEIAEPTTTQPAQQVEPIDAVVTLRAVGPVRIGMTVDEASAESGVTLRRDFGRQAVGNCYYVTPGNAMRGVSIMMVDDLIARIEIDSPSDIATRSGVRVGTAVSNLQEVYPDNIQRADDVAPGGQAMAFVPNDDFDADYRIYFEIEDGQVARYRVGVKPAVDYVGGCPEE